MSERPLILVTNDDGIHAPGLRALTEAVEPLGEVWVVAPSNPQSAMSHALTLHKPLRLKKQGERRFSCSGTPTDCVFLAVLHVLPRAPSLVVSGINHGPNLADDVSYSGTVSAALEAAIMGLPGIGFSHAALGDWDFHDGGVFARQISARVLAEGLPPRGYLNVNFPDVPRGEVQGVRVSTLGHRSYENCIVEASDPRGKPYYWIGGSRPQYTEIEGSDCTAVSGGYVAVTPLQSNPTDHAALQTLREWSLSAP